MIKSVKLPGQDGGRMGTGWGQDALQCSPYL